MINKYYDLLIDEIKNYIKIIDKTKIFKIQESINTNEITIIFNENKIIEIVISPYYCLDIDNIMEWKLRIEYTTNGMNEIIDKYSDHIMFSIVEDIDFSYYKMGYKIINQFNILQEINRLFTWNL